MSDSSEEEFHEEKWVFYKDRPDWKDVEAVPQDDGEHPIVSIAYSQKFVDVYNYLRGIMKTNEKSQRALDLTRDAVSLNAANYTVWQYRRDILKEINADLLEELKYVDKVIKKNQKNYQVWHHRRVIVEWLKDPSQELCFTESILQLDAKNYHAWQHRQWVIKTYNLYDEELQYVDYLLREDIRNNSAWNERYFVLNNTTGFTDEVVASEVEYTLDKISLAKENESAWNYLRGLLLQDRGGLSNNEKVTSFCENLFNSGDRSPFLLALIVDMCDEQINLGGSNPNYTLERAKELCNELATNYDTIRCKYWEYMALNIEKKVEKSDVAAGTSAGTSS